MVGFFIWILWNWFFRFIANYLVCFHNSTTTQTHQLTTWIENVASQQKLINKKGPLSLVYHTKNSLLLICSEILDVCASLNLCPSWKEETWWLAKPVRAKGAPFAHTKKNLHLNMPFDVSINWGFKISWWPTTLTLISVGTKQCTNKWVLKTYAHECTLITLVVEIQLCILQSLQTKGF